MRSPVVSVVIPSFQKGAFLGDALKSLSNQTHSNWEGILVENGSVDGSLDIAREWGRRDKRIRIIDASTYPKNGSLCRNLGLAASAGEFVLFLDADDLLASHCLASRISFAAASRDRDLFVFPIRTFKLRPEERTGNLWQPERRHPLSHLLFHRISWHTSGTLWRREFLQGIGGFDEGYSRFQDIETHVRGLLQSKLGFAVSRDPIPDAFYRCDEGRKHQSDSALLDDYIGSGMRFLREMRGHLEESDQRRRAAWLSGTGLVLLQRLRAGVINGSIASDRAERRASEVIQTGRANASWGPGTALLLKSYWNRWSRIASRIRGVNLVTRQMLSTSAVVRAGW